jgi:uncharacterized cupredoxin-like copper-binding protein
MNVGIAVLTAVLAVSAQAALAHGDAKHEKKASRPISTEETPFGREGDPKKVSRTYSVGMYDSMHFSVYAAGKPPAVSDAAAADRRSLPPGDLTVRRGETIRFVVRNDGKVMHEMVIGSMKELKEHAELMKKHPDMEHDEAYMAHVAPGKTGEIVWQFTQPGEFYYACLVPGHMEAGMIAKITVK